LLVGQLRPPFRVVLFNFFAHVYILHRSRNSWNTALASYEAAKWKLKARRLY
jgi:hypothetical protein